MEDDFKIIDQYLSGTLEGQERLDFESRLQKDETFKEQYHIVKDLENAIDPETEEFISVLNSVAEKTPDTAKLVGLWSAYRSKYLAIAASLLLLTAAIFLLKPKLIDSGDLYASYFESYPSTNSARGLDSGESLYNRAMINYEGRKFDLAINDFDAYLQTTKSEDALFYKAISLMSIDRHKDALPLLDQLFRNVSDYSDSAKWYAALAYLKLNNVDRASELLHSIINDTTDDYYKSRATDLLDELK